MISSENSKGPCQHTEWQFALPAGSVINIMCFSSLPSLRIFICNWPLMFSKCLHLLSQHTRKLFSPTYSHGFLNPRILHWFSLLKALGCLKRGKINIFTDCPPTVTTHKPVSTTCLWCLPDSWFLSFGAWERPSFSRSPLLPKTHFLGCY